LQNGRRLKKKKKILGRQGAGDMTRGKKAGAPKPTDGGRNHRSEGGGAV